MKVIDTFEIPEDLATELSGLLTKQTIRTNMLNDAIHDLDRFEQIEALLMPITERIEAIKAEITEKYVPDGYRSDRYTWNYQGMSIAGNRVQIIDNWQ